MDKINPIGFRVLNKAKEIPSIEIFDDIASHDYWGEYTPKKLKDELKNIKSDEINVYINSGGGEVYSGFAIYNMLVNHKAKINVIIEGIAGSIASVIAMAGDNITIYESAAIMIHNPWTFAAGDAEEMQEAAEQLTRIGEQLAKIYHDRTGVEIEEIKTMMNKETWMHGEEALQLGFVDESIGNKKVAACVCDLSNFKNVPDEILKAQQNYKKSMNKRDVEEGLRDLGYSKTEALNIVSRKKEADLSDSDKASKEEELEILNNFKIVI